MGTFWERAAHSVNLMFSLLCLFVYSLDCFPFSFRERDIGSDCVSSWSLLTFYFLRNLNDKICKTAYSQIVGSTQNVTNRQHDIFK